MWSRGLTREPEQDGIDSMAQLHQRVLRRQAGRVAYRGLAKPGTEYEFCYAGMYVLLTLFAWLVVPAMASYSMQLVLCSSKICHPTYARLREKLFCCGTKTWCIVFIDERCKLVKLSS
jgi:hypothetical protein